jgi:hypothetical protein
MITRRFADATWRWMQGKRYGGAQRALSTIGTRGADPQVATLGGSSSRTVIECRPLIVWHGLRHAVLFCQRSAAAALLTK